MIGIELCQEAVEDAKVNAKLNGKRPDNVKLPPAICAWNVNVVRSVMTGLDVILCLFVWAFLLSFFVYVLFWSVFHVFVFEGLSNVEFHCGKAEDVFPNVLSALVSTNITAIVDPPRAGLREWTTGRTRKWVSLTSRCLILKSSCLNSTQIPRWYLPSGGQSIWRDWFTWRAMPRQPWTTSSSESRCV